MEQGLEDEARRALPFRQQNALNTVGYKELFTYFDGQCTLEEAIEKIKSNTRAYSRKQNTWFNHDGGIVWFNAEEKRNPCLCVRHDKGIRLQLFPDFPNIF